MNVGRVRRIQADYIRLVGEHFRADRDDMIRRGMDGGEYMKLRNAMPDVVVDTGKQEYRGAWQYKAERAIDAAKWFWVRADGSSFED